MSSIGTVAGGLTRAHTGIAAHEGAAVPTAPARAAGVELLGAVAGSGYRRQPSLVRRADGQTVQLTQLLYQLLDAVDGTRDHGELGRELSRRTGRDVAAEDVRYLLDAKLQPLGVLRRPDGSEPITSRPDPLLALSARVVVSNPRTSRLIAAPLAPLFHPALVAAVVVAFAATAWWIVVEKGLGSAARQALYQPEALLLVFGLTLLSAGFHELGHAAACRYGGVAPGRMGVGLYLVWPAFYTDVSDAYRLSRGGRLRVDLGGLYFNAIFALVALAVWLHMRWDALLLVIAAQMLQMLRQLVPIVRFDGYHVLADLTGVPDLFLHVKPTLLGLLPGRRGRRHALALKPWARAVVTAWVLLVVPLLAAVFAGLVLAFPRLAATAWDSLGLQSADVATRWSQGDGAGVLASVLSMLTILLPVLGIAYMLFRIVRRIVRGALRATAGRPVQRSAAAVVGATVVAFVAWAWWPDGQYQPLDASAEWHLRELRPVPVQLAAAAAPPPAPTATPPSTAPAPGVAAPAPQRPTTSTAGRWAVVAMPRASLDAIVAAAEPRSPAPSGQPPLPGAPQEPPPSGPLPAPEATPPVAEPPPPSAAGGSSWPFPWAEPREPHEGDNQVVAVNTTDGSSTSDVVLALVWVTDGSDVEQRNEAWALASCSGCRTRAVAFQIVLVIGYAEVVAPVNSAVAANWECETCATEALAVQLVATLSREPTAETKAALEAIWAELLQKRASFQLRPLAEVWAELRATEARVLETLARDSGVSSSTDEADADAADGEDAAPEPDPPSGAETDPEVSEPPPASTTDEQDGSDEAAPDPQPCETEAAGSDETAEAGSEAEPAAAEPADDRECVEPVEDEPAAAPPADAPPPPPADPAPTTTTTP